jgi:hypothetical protein
MKKAITLSASVPAVLATAEAAEDDATALAMRVEENRYERVILDFECAIRHERDRLRAEHLGNVRSIMAEAAE